MPKRYRRLTHRGWGPICHPRRVDHSHRRRPRHHRRPVPASSWSTARTGPANAAATSVNRTTLAVTTSTGASCWTARAAATGPAGRPGRAAEAIGSGRPLSATRLFSFLGPGTLVAALVARTIGQGPSIFGSGSGASTTAGIGYGVAATAGTAAVKPAGLAGPLRAALVPLGAVWPGPAMGRQLRGDSRGHRTLQQLDPVGISGLGRAGRFDRYDGYAVDPKFRFCPHNIAGFGPAVEQRCVECPLRLEGSSRTPSPGAVGPRAGQLYLYTAGHRTKVQLRGRSANRGAPSSENAILSL